MLQFTQISSRWLHNIWQAVIGRWAKPSWLKRMMRDQKLVPFKIYFMNYWMSPMIKSAYLNQSTGVDNLAVSLSIVRLPKQNVLLHCARKHPRPLRYVSDGSVHRNTSLGDRNFTANCHQDRGLWKESKLIQNWKLVSDESSLIDAKLTKTHIPFKLY